MVHHFDKEAMKRHADATQLALQTPVVNYRDVLAHKENM